jgi:single-stranded-DNA-specific exonuclease
MLLGVERSFTGRLWRSRAGDERTALALSQRLRLPEIVGRVLAARGVGLEEAEAFLSPTLRDHLPDPFVLKDMDKAAKRLATAVTTGENIAIFGDYDVDGATSSALLARFLRATGREARIYIPDRVKEGYGPNDEAMRKLKAEGISLVVTVDCGITAFLPLASPFFSRSRPIVSFVTWDGTRMANASPTCCNCLIWWRLVPSATLSRSKASIGLW